jgi:hypothetical protein
MAKRGRPLKDEASRKSEPVSIRLTPELRTYLEAERMSVDPERTLSQEIELRIKESFDFDKSIKHLFGGADLYWLLRLVAEEIVLIEHWTGRDFLTDRFTFDQAKDAVDTIFDHFKSPGVSSPPERLTILLDERMIKTLGKRSALLELAQLELADMRSGDILALPGFVDPSAARHLSGRMQKSAIAQLKDDWRRTQAAAGTVTAKSRRKPK